MRLGRGTMRAAAVLVVGLALAVAGYSDSLKVKTAEGVVRGKTIDSGKVRVFLGLPYAAAPVGELRWKAPAAPVKWKGVRDGTQYGARCMQAHVFDDMVFQDAGPSEDCLFANVFTPKEASAKHKLPVMVWIHGGGFSTGAGSEPRHTGAVLPEHGVVLVTINYRLGVFGFLATPELKREGNGSAGNYGLMDQVAALKWVKENIAQFGGDPDKVTIFGESAGSISVCALMAAPSAQGLFAGAIGESGGIAAQMLQGLDAAVASGGEWAKAQGGRLADLRKVSADVVLAAATKKGVTGFWPMANGSFLPEKLDAIYAAGKQAHVPLLAGWNRDEQSGLSQGMTAEKWKAYAAEKYGERAAEFLKAYPGGTDEEAVRSAIDYQSDSFIAAGTWAWVDGQVKTGAAPVYRYHFDLAAPSSQYHKGEYAFHSDDIEYVFGTLDTRPGAAWRPEDRKLSEEIVQYWTNFAKTGDPNGAGLAEWPRFDKSGLVEQLDRAITAEPDGLRSRYEWLLNK